MAEIGVTITYEESGNILNIHCSENLVKVDGVSARLKKLNGKIMSSQISVIEAKMAPNTSKRQTRFLWPKGILCCLESNHKVAMNKTEAFLSGLYLY